LKEISINGSPCLGSKTHFRLLIGRGGVILVVFLVPIQVVDGKLQTRAHRKHPGERTGSSVAVCTHWLSNKGWPILVVVAIIQACCEPTADR